MTVSHMPVAVHLHVLKAARHGAARVRRSAKSTSRVLKFARGRISVFVRSARRSGASVSRALGAVMIRRARRWRRAVTEAARLVYYRVPGERATCPACGAAAVQLLEPLRIRCQPGQPKRHVRFISGCRRCGVLFTNPMPAAAEVARFYSPSGEWAQAVHEEGRRRPNAPVHYLITRFQPLMPDFDITRPPSCGAALDLGCGCGDMLDVLNGFGWQTFGIDPADRRAFDRHRELHEIPREPAFDVVLLHHVLEHVHAPLAILRALHRALRPGGVVLISVPGVDTLAEHRDFEYCINGRTHLFAYSRNAMATLLAKAGFETIDLPPRGGGLIPERLALRRLQVIGRRRDESVRPPRDPLAAARTALQRFHDASGVAAPAPAWLPVRMRAALYDHRLQRPHRAAAWHGRVSTLG